MPNEIKVQKLWVGYIDCKNCSNWADVWLLADEHGEVKDTQSRCDHCGFWYHLKQSDEINIRNNQK